MKNKYQSMEDHTPTIVKTNTFYILVCLSLILIGFLLGVSLEDSISVYLRRTTIDFSDIVASIGLTVTAGFAYFGLKEQRQQKAIQAEPYLHPMITIDREKSHYELELVNSGPGAAIDIVYCLIWEESVSDEKFEVIGMLTFRSFMQKATDSSRDFIMQYSTPKALRSSDKANFLEISLEVPDSKKFTRIENVLRRTTLKLSYKTTLGELREKSFGLRK
ncbi:hypothetical protein [Pseudoalteromonas sp. NJ631]|uniref:hypothetical protein n=1 Tax=Pseudoalteromonas sp. NJ631 TaxID=493915 RepID=UPI0012FA7A09|nr:hypothetical protein [Pseudoalteromonas sp. NJ631]